MTDINPASWVSRMMQKDGAGSSNLKCQVALDTLRCARSMPTGSLWERSLRGDSEAIFKFLLAGCISLEVALHDAPSTAVHLCGRWAREAEQFGTQPKVPANKSGSGRVLFPQP